MQRAKKMILGLQQGLPGCAVSRPWEPELSMQTVIGNRLDHGFPQIPAGSRDLHFPGWDFPCGGLFVPVGSILNRFIRVNDASTFSGARPVHHRNEP